MLLQSDFFLGEDDDRSNDTFEEVIGYRKAKKRTIFDVDNLIHACNEKLKNQPCHQKALFIRASSFIKKNMFLQSIQDCDKLIQIDDQNSGAYYVRGCANEKLGQIDKCIEDFSTVLRIDPDHINAAYARGAAENRRGNFAKAIDDYHMALQKDHKPSSPIGMALQNANSLFPSPSQPNFERKQERMNSSKFLNGSKDSFSQDFPQSISNSNLFKKRRYSSENYKKSPEYYSQYLNPHPANQSFQFACNSNQNNSFSLSGYDISSTKSPQKRLFSSNQKGRKQGEKEKKIEMSTHNNSLLGNGKEYVSFSEEMNSEKEHRTLSELRDLQNTSNNSYSCLHIENTGSHEKKPVNMILNLCVNECYGGNSNDTDQNYCRQNGTANRSMYKNGNGISDKNGNVEDRSEREAEYFHSQGYAMRKAGNYEQAILFYSKALQFKPNFFKVLFNRGFAYDQLSHFSKAIADYDKAIRIDPHNPYTYYNRGISLDRSSQYDHAIRDFSTAIQLCPQKSDFYHNRGFAYRKKCDYRNAISDYTTAIAIQPHHFKAHYNRAFCWEKIGKLREAEEDYFTAARIQPNNLTPLFHLGIIQEKMGGTKLTEAIENFSKVLEIDDKFSPAYNSRALVLEKLNEQHSAIEDFTRAIQFSPENEIYFHNRACCLRNMNKLHESLKDFQHALDLNRTNPSFFSNRGLTYRKLGDYESAIDDYSKELKLIERKQSDLDSVNSKKSDLIKSLKNRGFCFAKLGRYSSAVEDYTRVLEINPTNLHTLMNRAISYQRLSQYLKAIADFTMSITINSQLPNIYFNRGCCYDSLGEFDLAVTDYAIALQLENKITQSQTQTHTYTHAHAS